MKCIYRSIQIITQCVLNFRSSLAFQTFPPPKLGHQTAKILNPFLPGSPPTINLKLFAYLRLTILGEYQLLHSNILGS